MIQREIINPYRSAYRTLIITAFSINLIALFGFGVGSTDIAFWIGALQFMMFGAGIALLIFGRLRAQKFSIALNGNELLAHWTYDDETGRAFATQRYTKNKKTAQRAMILFLIIGPVLELYHRETISLQYGLLLGVILGSIAFVSGRIYAFDLYRRNYSKPYDAFITRSAVMVFNELILWDTFAARFVGVAIIPSDHSKTSSALSFTYRSLYRLRKGESTVLVPIPSDKRDEAEKILSSFRSAA